MSKYTLLFCSHPIILSALYQKPAEEAPETSSSEESDESIDLENDSTTQEEEETGSESSNNDSASGEEVEEDSGDEEEEEESVGEEGSEEEDVQQSEEEEEETENTTDIKRFTAKGKERLRSVKWNENEKFALFFNINRLNATLKGRGRENKKSKEAAWEEVKGKKIPVSYHMSC